MHCIADWNNYTNKMQEEIKLIQCASCSKEISPLAAQCPNCGAPNEWIHPSIHDFLKVKDQTGISRPFTFQWNKSDIWGESKPKANAVGWLIYAGLLPLSLYWLFSYGIIGALLCGAAIGVALQVVPRVWGSQETFKANVLKREWTSSNEKYWAPVKSSLKL